MTNEMKVQKEFELDNLTFQIEAQELKIRQIEKSIIMEMPRRSAEWDLAQAKKALEIQKNQVDQIRKGLKELNKKEKK